MIDNSLHPTASVKQWLHEDISRLLWDKSSVNVEGEDSGVWMYPLRAAALNQQI